MKNKYTKLALLILLFGLVRLPLETSLDETIREQRLRDKLPADLSLYESLGQQGAAAVIGGLRPALATFFYLEALTDFSELRWYELMNGFNLITQIQPRTGFYWEFAVWHTAWNAASSYRDRDDLPKHIRREKFFEFVDYGIEFGERGLKYVHDDPVFYHRMGELYTSRKPDPASAADYYFMAHVVSGRDHFERIYATTLVKRQGEEHWCQAYEILKRHYDQGRKSYSMLIDLKKLEERLGIPAKDRIPEKAPEDNRNDFSALPDYVIQAPLPSTGENGKKEVEKPDNR